MRNALRRSRFMSASWSTLVTTAVFSAGCQSATPSTATQDTCAGASSGTICTVAGNGTKGYDGGGNHRLDSWIYFPVDLAFDAKNTLYLLDWNNHRVRRVAADETLESVIGMDGTGDGDLKQLDLTSAGAPGDTVALNHPSDLLFAAIDSPVARQGDMLLDSWHNHRIRTWTPATGLVHVTCGITKEGLNNSGFSGDGKPLGTATLLNQPSKLVQDKAGNTYIIDSRNWRVRKIAADGMVSTVAGSGKPGPVGDDGVVDAKKATFLFFAPAEWSNPENPGGGIAISEDGKTLYVADTENHRIRAVDLVAGTVRTIAGSGPSGCVDIPNNATGCANDNINPPQKGDFAGDNGPATAARLNEPHDLAWGPDGRLYFADASNHRIRAIDLKTGILTTVVGSGKAPNGVKPFAVGDLGDGGPATSAALNHPQGLTFDQNGTLYIADTYNQRIRKVVK